MCINSMQIRNPQNHDIIDHTSHILSKRMLFMIYIVKNDLNAAKYMKDVFHLTHENCTINFIDKPY